MFHDFPHYTWNSDLFPIKMRIVPFLPMKQWHFPGHFPWPLFQWHLEISDEHIAAELLFPRLTTDPAITCRDSVERGGPGQGRYENPGGHKGCWTWPRSRWKYGDKWETRVVEVKLPFVPSKRLEKAWWTNLGTVGMEFGVVYCWVNNTLHCATFGYPVKSGCLVWKFNNWNNMII